MTDRSAIDRRLAALLDQYGRVLRRAIARTCPPHAGLDLDDIEQDARMRVWRVLAGEREIDRPASFLYRVAVTATLDALRRARARWREVRVPAEGAEDVRRKSNMTVASAIGSTASPDPERHTARRELLDTVLERLARLSDDRRRAVSLHVQGFTTREIARLLDWTEPKARNLVYRGLADLRAKLRAEGIYYASD